MKTKLYSILMLSASVLGASSCSDDDTATVFVPDSHNIIKINFYITDEPAENTFTVKITPRSYPEFTPTVLSHDATVYLEADPAKVESFNRQRGTNYKVMPPEAYTIAPKTIIKAGKNESEPISILIDGKDKMEQFTNYMLPVSIVGAEGIATDDCCQTIYFVYRGSSDPSGATLFDRSGWIITGVSSEEPREGEWGHGGMKEHCIDGDINTFWGTDWATDHPLPPHWITFDLGEELKISGFAIQAREEGSDGPATITLEVSNDGENWTDAGQYEDITARGEHRSFLRKPVTGRYVKLTITEVHGGPHVTVSEFNLF